MSDTDNTQKPGPTAEPGMSWYELLFETDVESADAFSGRLAMAGHTSCELRDNEGPTASLQDGRERYPAGRCGVAIFAQYVDEAAARSAAEQLAGSGAPEGGESLKTPGAEVLVRNVKAVDETAWTENWRGHFPPLQVGDRIEVIPPWEDGTPGRLTLEIHPGMAFGTGHHETTTSSLALLEKRIRGGERVADIGCGTGILAIAALKLGAAAAVAVDNDPEAVRATWENAARNATDYRLVPGLVHDDLSPAAPDSVDFDSCDRELPGCDLGIRGRDSAVGFAESGYGKKFDVLAANILAETLVELHDGLLELLAQDACLILSGIERSRLPLIQAAFIRDDWREAETLLDGDWATIMLTRSAA